MELEVGAVVGNYRIEALLARGGVSVVYVVRHERLKTLHALKVLQLPADAIRERLVREGRVQAGLRHENIVNVTEILDIHREPGLIMEYVSGGSLEDLLHEGPVPLATADRLAQGILRGVAFAHRHEVVHRDLKPGNVLLSETPEGPVPKVTDFGLMKLLSAEAASRTLTRSGTAMGTLPYMSPEQFKDSKRIDRRTDVFSLGAILYELVCGRRAFPGTHMVEIGRQVVTGVVKKPRELVPDLPEAFEAAILGALTVDRDARIPDCETLLSVWSGRTAWGPGAVAKVPAATAPEVPPPVIAKDWLPEMAAVHAPTARPNDDSRAAVAPPESQMLRRFGAVAVLAGPLTLAAIAVFLGPCRAP